MLLQIAWKNIWRNKIRSIVLLTAIAIGIFAGMFNMAFYYGMAEQRIETAIKTEASHIQIHADQYMEDPEVNKYLPEGEKIKKQIAELSEVKHVSSRLLVNAMVTSAETGSGVKVFGINPAEERLVTDIHTRLIDGKYLEGISRNPILIGEKLAEKLKLGVRKKLVLTLQNKNGDMVYASFRVAGIYKTANTMFDEVNVFVRQEDIRKLLDLDPGNSHEIAILLKSNDDLQPTVSALKKEFPDTDIKTWAELMPEVGLIEESMDVSMYIFMGIILFALLFGIINTMLMAVLERRKELGMLMAVGMNQVRVFFMILFETVLLSITGGIVGILLGALASLIFSRQGIDLSTWGQAYESMGYDTIVYPIFNVLMSARVVLMVLITGFIASIYPAVKALKLKPAEAIRIDI